MNQIKWFMSFFLIILVIGCGDDDITNPPPPSSSSFSPSSSSYEPPVDPIVYDIWDTAYVYSKSIEFANCLLYDYSIRIDIDAKTIISTGYQICNDSLHGSLIDTLSNLEFLYDSTTEDGFLFEEYTAQSTNGWMIAIQFFEDYPYDIRFIRKFHRDCGDNGEFCDSNRDYIFWQTNIVQ